MTDGAIYKAGWTLADVDWQSFDRTKVDPDLLAAVKAASLVEYNAADYVSYLTRVYRGSPQSTLAAIEHWGREEIQHGLALARWAMLADPSFDFEGAVARFRALYRPAHFDQETGSVRGSKRGEMISRCVVESGTSSFYSAIRDASAEPALKEVAARIAGDEFRHYQMFFQILKAEAEPDLPRWRKVWVAFTRLTEADDDELACAYYCANVAPEQVHALPYRRLTYARAYRMTMMALYRRRHIEKLVKMVALPAGLNPAGRLCAFLGAVLWYVLSFRTGIRTASRKAAA